MPETPPEPRQIGQDYKLKGKKWKEQPTWLREKGFEYWFAQLTQVYKRWSEVDMLSLAAQVYEGLSDKEIEEIEAIALDRRNFFGNRSS